MATYQPNITPREWSIVDADRQLPTDADLMTIARSWANQNRRRDPMTRFRHLFCLRHVARTFQTGMTADGTDREPSIRIMGGDTVGVIAATPPPNRRYPDLIIDTDRASKADYWVLVLYHGADREPEVLGWINALQVLECRAPYHRGTVIIPPLKLQSIGRLIDRHDSTLPGAYTTGEAIA